jgi:hypothetical protein
MRNKRMMVLVVLALAAMAAFAGGTRDTVTVEGVVTMVDSRPALVSGDTTRVLPAGPFYRAAWENGIKEGDTVKIEGFERVLSDDGSETRVVMPNRVWFKGSEVSLPNAGRDGPGACFGPGKDGPGGMRRGFGNQGACGGVPSRRGDGAGRDGASRPGTGGKSRK